MPAQRRQTSSKVIRPQPRPRSASLLLPLPDAGAESAELRQLYQTRADALMWLAVLERRIGALGGVVMQMGDEVE